MIAVSRRDLRTRQGRREEILEQIQQHGGFSIFWIADNRVRASVAQKMQDSGEIVTDTKTCGFPWIKVTLATRTK